MRSLAARIERKSATTLAWEIVSPLAAAWLAAAALCCLQPAPAAHAADASAPAPMVSIETPQA